MFCASHNHITSRVRCRSTVEPQGRARGCVTFDSAGDVEESIFIVLAEVTRVQPPVLIDRLFGLVFHVQVAHEDVAAREADLPVAVSIWLMNQCPAARDFPSAAQREHKHKAVALISVFNSRLSSRLRLCQDSLKLKHLNKAGQPFIATASARSLQT